MNRDVILYGGLALSFLCISAAAYLFLQDQKIKPKFQAPSAPAGQVHPLVKEQGVSLLYKLDQQTQDTLIAAVEQFCVKTYERESCIHHFSTCGRPCLVVIPENVRDKILADYKTLRKSRGLPDLKPLPKDDE